MQYSPIYSEKNKEDQNQRKRLSRNKRKIEDPKGLARYENQANLKRKKFSNASDRLKEFKMATSDFFTTWEIHQTKQNSFCHYGLLLIISLWD